MPPSRLIDLLQFEAFLKAHIETNWLAFQTPHHAILCSRFPPFLFPFNLVNILKETNTVTSLENPQDRPGGFRLK